MTLLVELVVCAHTCMCGLNTTAVSVAYDDSAVLQCNTSNSIKQRKHSSRNADTLLLVCITHMYILLWRCTGMYQCLLAKGSCRTLRSSSEILVLRHSSTA
jgi:hypothetical protein